MDSRKGPVPMSTALGLELAGLLARVEAATGPDTDKLMGGLHDRLWRWVNDNKLNANAPGWEYDLHEGPNYTASLDAALGLCERVLPGCRVLVEKTFDGEGWAMLQTAPAEPRDMTEGYTPALALLAAMLCALIASAVGAR